MQTFKERVKQFYWSERHTDISTVEFRDMPQERSRYNLSKVIGNVNLTEGRFKIKADADRVIDHFLAAPLP